MSFRTEEKLVFHKSDHQNLLKFIHNENAKKIFFKRQIKSIYFDNKLRQSYFNSEEGVVPRKTIRIRSYDEFETNSLEVKINSVEGKFKQSINLDKKKILQFNSTWLF